MSTNKTNKKVVELDENGVMKVYAVQYFEDGWWITSQTYANADDAIKWKRYLMVLGTYSKVRVKVDGVLF